MIILCVTGNRYGVVSQPGTGMHLCDGVYNAADRQYCSMSFCVLLRTSYSGECKKTQNSL